MHFTDKGIYRWADIGGLGGGIEKEIEWDPSWDDKRDRLRLVDDKVIIAPDTTYKRNRKMAYPEIGDQLDDLFRKGVFSDEMAATLQAVKDKYPKG